MKTLFHTKKTRIDNSYEVDDAEYLQTFAYRMRFLRAFYYADCTDPRIEEYTSLDDALKDLDCTDYWVDVDYGFAPYNEIFPVFDEVWVDANDDEIEEGKTGLRLEELEEKFDFEFEFETEDIIARHFFDSAFEKYWDLLYRTQDALKEMLGSFQYDGYSLKLDSKHVSKYSDISVLKDGEKIDSIQLRIANHSYNPMNNNQDAWDGKFVSVVIANNDPTANKYHGKHNLWFRLDSNEEEIVCAVFDKFEEIIENLIKE